MQEEKQFRITRQRQIMLEVMRNMRFHPTASQLYDAVRHRLPSISLATVYRNLEVMAARGLIQKITTNGRSRLFDVNPEIHYHARCVRCGAIMDVAIAPETMSLFRDKLDAVQDFVILDARVEFIGHCGACAGRLPGRAGSVNAS